MVRRGEASSGVRQRARWSRGRWLGLLIAFALVIYPAIGKLVGHDYPASPTFGLPCPTTIFTVGVLLLTKATTPRWVYVAPVLWSMIGSAAAFLLGVYQDLGLLVAGFVALWAMFSSAGRGQARLHVVS